MPARSWLVCTAGSSCGTVGLTVVKDVVSTRRRFTGDIVRSPSDPSFSISKSVVYNELEIGMKDH